MAEPITRKFIIDTTESEQNLKELNVQINATSTAINSSAQSFENVAAAEEEVGEATLSLKAQLKDLQVQLANAEPDSEAYVELAQAASEVKDKIADASEAIGTQAGGVFERVGNSLGLVTGRIASLDFEGAAEGAKLLAKNITDFKPSDITNGIKGIGSAFTTVGKALLTNPLFLIGAAIAAAIVYADELLTLVDGVTDAELEQLEVQKQRAAQSKQQLDDVSAQENILRLQGKTEREILQIKIAKANQAILDQKAVIQTLEIQRQQQIDAAERNRKITSGIIQFLTIPLQLLLGTVDTITGGLNAIGVVSDETFAKIGNQRDKFNKSLSSLVFDPSEVAAEGDKAVAEQKKILKDLENQQAGFQLSVNQIDQKAIDDKKAAQDKAAADAKAKQDKSAADAKSAAAKAAEERLKALEKYYEDLAKLEDEKFQATLSKDEQEQLALIQKYETLFADADAAKKNTVELQRQLNAELAQLQVQQTERALEQAKKRRQSEEQLLLNEQAFIAQNIKNELERIQAERGLIEAEQKIRLNALQSEVDKYKEGTEEKLNAQIAYNEAAQGYNQKLAQNTIALEQATINRTNELLNIRASLEIGSTDARIEALKAEYAEKEKLYANDAEMLLALETEKQDKIRKLQLDAFQQTLDLGQQGLTAIQGFLDASFIKQEQGLKAEQDAELLAFEESYAKRFATVEQGSEAEKKLTETAQKDKEAILKRNEKKQLEFAKKQFQAQKKMQLAGAVVDAAKAATSSLSQSPVAIGVVPNPVGIASLALALTTGAASIAKIAATKFESPAVGGDIPTGSVGASGGTESQAAEFNPFASSFLEDRPDQLTPRAYVLAGDVASQQEVRIKVEDLSRIG